MDFDFSSEQQMLKDGAQRYVREKYDFESRRQIAASGPGWSAAHWAAFAELGWLALGVPEEFGGLGCSFVDTCILAEAFGRGLVLEPYTSTAILCSYILEHWQNAEGRDALLAEIAEGGKKLALAHEEPGISHRRHASSTQALTVSSGYRLSGRKTMVFDAPFVDQFIISCSLEDGDLALFLAASDTPGLWLKPYKLIDGSRAADLELDGMVLDASALLLRGAAAQDLLDAALDRAVLAQAAEALGAMQAVLEITSSYIKERTQFGQPIGKFQALQHRMAEMFTEAQSARSILYHGLASIDAAPAQRAAAVSAVKVATSAAGFFVGSQGIQLHGGMGMTEEFPVGHYFKRLVALEKAYGDGNWHLARYAALRVEQG
jgi:alkylation response protein AidB-like acyl-CoA dehydrogenase